ncbi:MAG: hypothetical protein QW390_04355 [Candidatus Bathyarchaeia archaeon]
MSKPISFGLLIFLCLLQPLSTGAAYVDRRLLPQEVPLQKNAWVDRFLEAESVNVSTFTINASLYTPTVTVVGVEERRTTVAVSQEGGLSLSEYLPAAIVIASTAAVAALIVKRQRSGSGR